MNNFWTDELVAEFVKKTVEAELVGANYVSIEYFKASKTKKDWEIVEFKHVGVGIMPKDKDGTFYTQRKNDNWAMKESDCLENPHDYSIHAVRRLSDNVVFRVGDKGVVENGTITRFKVSDNKLFAYVSFANVGGEWDICLFNSLKKSLFTTHDGKEIFEGDRYWWLNNQVGNWDIWEDKGDSKMVAKGDVQFATRETAEGYVIRNRPMFSIDDVVSNKMVSDIFAEMIKSLQKIAKERCGFNK